VNDGAQRELLRAVAAVKLAPDSKAYVELNWVLEQIKQQIANQRNTGVHMPLMIFSDMSKEDSAPVPQILPLALFGNRKANAMLGKDLLKEFAHYEQQIRKLGGYLFAISFNISPVRTQPESWPERPKLQPHAPK
jgi:hypothetical protein